MLVSANSPMRVMSYRLTVAFFQEVLIMTFDILELQWLGFLFPNIGINIAPKMHSISLALLYISDQLFGLCA